MVTGSFNTFPEIQPVTNITPFTYRDGTTLLGQLEKMRVHLNEHVVPGFNEKLNWIIGQFNDGLLTVEQFHDAYAAEIDRRIMLINNRVGPEDMKRVTVTAPYTLTIDSVWPDAHPLWFQITQDAIGGHTVTFAPEIASTVVVNTAANAMTEFVLVPLGNGKWVAKRYITKAELDATSKTLTDEISLKLSASVFNDYKGTTDASFTDVRKQISDNAGTTTTELGKKANVATTPQTAFPVGMIMGAIRNDGNGWYAIDDANHTPSFIDSVTTTNQMISVHYNSLGATESTTFIVVPDETLAKAGFHVGASVGLDASHIMLSQSGKTYSDYVWFDGSDWRQSDGVFSSVTWDSGILTITHPTITDGGHFNVALTGRGGNYTPNLIGGGGALGFDVLRIEFRGADGTTPTVPNSGMRVYVSHGGGNRIVDPTTVSAATYPKSNLWIIGAMRK